MASRLLGVDFIGGEMVWWRDDHKPSYQSKVRSDLVNDDFIDTIKWPCNRREMQECGLRTLPGLHTLIHKAFKTKYLSSFQPLLFSFYVQIILLIWIWNHKICFYQQEKIQYWNWQVWILTLINHFLSKPMPFWGQICNLSVIWYVSI